MSTNFLVYNQEKSFPSPLYDCHEYDQIAETGPEDKKDAFVTKGEVFYHQRLLVLISLLIICAITG